MRWFVLVALVAGCGTPPPPPPPPVVEAPPAPVEAPPPPAAPPAASKRIYFVEPVDGAEVTSPVKVVFGVEGVTVEPAGTVVAEHGHHHLIVDGEPIPAGTAVPADATHIHFGKAQTETTVELAPGPHTLTMQFADGRHMSYGPELASTIHVTVK
jgi:hypothetical protein